MSLTYDYKDNKPHAKIRLKILGRNGVEKITQPLDILVDTGASNTTLPESLLTEYIGWFPKTVTEGFTAGARVRLETVTLSGAIEFLNDDGEVFDVVNFKGTTIVLREVKLLGLDVINNHIYEFNGRGKTLKITPHDSMN